MKNTFNLRHPINLPNMIILMLAGWLTDVLIVVIAFIGILAVTVRYIDDSVNS